MSFNRQYHYLTTPVRFTSYATETDVIAETTVPIVSFPEIKTFVPIRDGVDDIVLLRFIKGVTQKIENYIQRDATVKTRQAYYLYPKERLFLPFGVHGDIEFVKSVDSDGTETALVAGTDYHIEGLKFKTLRLNNSHYSIITQFQSGYAQCPDAIIGAILQEFSFQYKNRSDPNQGSRLIVNGLTVEARNLLVDGGFVNYHG
jgi:hypothetical protein